MARYTIAMSLFWSKDFVIENSHLSQQLFQVDDIKEEVESPFGDMSEISLFDHVILGNEYVVLKGSVKVLTEGKEDKILTAKLQTLLQKTIDSWYISWGEMNLPEKSKQGELK